MRWFGAFSLLIGLLLAMMAIGKYLISRHHTKPCADCQRQIDKRNKALSKQQILEETDSDDEESSEESSSDTED